MSDEIDAKSAYKYKSMKWALCNEDFSDLTVSQIAEVFDVEYDYIIKAIIEIEKRTGFIVKCIRKEKKVI